MPGKSSVDDSKNVAIEHDKETQIRNYEALAALETIRINQFVPFTLYKKQVTGNDTTNQKLTFEKFDPGYIYVITSICGWNNTDAAHQIRIGAIIGGTDHVFTSSTIANIGDSGDYVGQLMLKEGDQVYVEFWAAGAEDDIFATVNGYKIKR